MGKKNADRVPLIVRRARGETVTAMQAEAWDVISNCQKCGLLMPVDLAVVAKIKGPAFSLWNRKARCKRIGCNGWVTFQAKAPGMSGFEDLATPNLPSL